MGNRLAGSQLVFLVESSTDADTRRRRGAAGSLDRHRSRRRLRRAGADGGRLSHRSAPSRPRRLAASSASSASPPPSPRRLLRLLHAASVAERADRALCSLVCAGTSTRRDLRCEVSRSRRICPASQLTCSRTHASPALGRRHLIGAMVNTRSISSSASAAAPSPPRQLPPRHAAPCSRRPRGAAGRGQRLAGGRACARRSARRREGVSGGVRSPVQRRPLVVWAAAQLRADAQRAAAGRASGAAAQAPLWGCQRRVDGCGDRCRMRRCCSGSGRSALCGPFSCK
jgi:hypothetical protein